MPTPEVRTTARPALSRRAAAFVTTVAFASSLSLAGLAQQPPPPATAPPTAQPAPSAPPPAAAQPPPGYGAPPGQEPPPGYGAPLGQEPPPGYGAPPPGYGAPPGYGYGPPPEAYGPEEMDYEEGMTIPPGYERDTKIRKGLVIGGAVTFGAMWLISVVTGAVAMDWADRGLTTQTQGEAAMLLIPVAGPFISISTYDAESGATALLVLDGVAQAGGLAMFIAGLAAKREVLVRRGDVQLTVAPVVGGGRAGMGVVGTF